MIVEQRTYTIKPLRMQEFLSLYERTALPLQKKYLEYLIGFFVSEVGTLSQVVHLWRFESLGDRERRRLAMTQDPGWLSYLNELRMLDVVVHQQSVMLKPVSFSPQ